MKYLSLFSGIEAASVAWGPLGFTPVAFAEIERFPSAVLAYHYPDVPNLGDVTAVDWPAFFDEHGIPDIICAGSPCQAFSVAGRRRSLKDARGNLTLFTAELVRLANPRFFLWENVPGVLNTDDNAFGCFLAELVGADAPLVAPGGRWGNAGLVMGPEGRLAWRVLDAQWYGLAQRRKRVFLVRCPLDGPDPADVLFEREGVQRHSEPSREAGEGAAAAATLGAHGGSGYRLGLDNETYVPTVFPILDATARDKTQNGLGIGAPCDPCPTLTAGDRHGVAVAFSAGNSGESFGIGYSVEHTPPLRAGMSGTNQVPTVCAAVHEPTAEGARASEDGTGRGTPIIMAPAFSKRPGQQIATRDDGLCYALTAGEPPRVATEYAVRRLMPEEAELLQGFDVGYTAIPWRGKSPAECPDGPRYEALGNSWAVPVVRRIGERMQRELHA